MKQPTVTLSFKAKTLSCVKYQLNHVNCFLELVHRNVFHWIIPLVVRFENLYVFYQEAANGWRCSIKEGVLKNFTKFTEKHLCWSFLRTYNFIKKRLQHRYFPVSFAKFLLPPILNNIILSDSGNQLHCVGSKEG